MKKKALVVPLDNFRNVPYDPMAPIKKGTYVYKVNSKMDDLIPNGTKGITHGAIIKKSKDGYVYLVEFKIIHRYHNAPGIPVGTYYEIHDDYISETQPTL